MKNKQELLSNARSPKLQKARQAIIEVVDRAIESANPSLALRSSVRVEGELLRVGDHELDLSEVAKIIVVGAGKACGEMARALEQILGDRITGGAVVVPKGSSYGLRRIKLLEGSHPIPNELSLQSAKQLLELVEGLGPKDLVICLLSGGGSALATLPAQGVSLEELRKTTQELLKSGAPIEEVNAVRKHLSRFKGGQLARAAHPARVVTLLISDVVGSRLDTIASGPTYPDSTTFSDALEVVEKYGLVEKLPPNVVKRLRQGARGELPETPKAGEECFKRAIHEIIASNSSALEAAAELGKSLGFGVEVLTPQMRGEAREVGRKLIKMGLKSELARPAMLLAGGETTVTVKGEGLGGRNQELALAAALELDHLPDAALVAFSTDGIDGPTDAAGALADSLTLERARELGLDPQAYLKRNDSYRFFQELGDLVFTGPTNTNVADLVCLVLT